MAEGGGDGGDEAALREEISRLRAELGASEDSRAREREELEGRALEVRQKAKDHIEQLQGKMRQVIERKDERLSEVEAQKAALESELAAARAAADAAAESRGVAGPLGDALAEQLQAAARERDEAREECAAMKVKLESLEAQFSALSATPEGQSGDMAEVARAQRESEAKMQEVVRRAKEHVMQVQAKLATSMTENKELSERYQEVNEAYKQQQEKVTKYKQLMAQANARIEESDENVRELKDALSKSQAQRLTMASQMGSMQSNFVPPTADEVSQRGGVLLAVETPDGEDVWCLVRRPEDGGASAEASSEATADQGAQHCWHLLSQLEGVEGPVPLQRRWKGEVSALRAQMSRFKKKSEDVQEAFDAYKEKANAALQNGAVQSQEMLLRDRRLEELGEQLQATSLELRRSEEHKDRALADLGEARRRQQEASSRALDLERALERCQREGEEKAEAAAARGASAFEARKVELEQQWYEKERGYQRDLDLRRTQTESLKEEIERLNARVFSQQAAAAALRAEASAPGPEDGAGPPSEGGGAPSLEVRSAVGSDGPPASTRAGAPLSPRCSPRSSSGAGAEHEEQLRPDAAQPSSASAPPPPPPPPPGGGSAGERPRPGTAYTLQDSMARQDLIALRSQLRQLEAQAIAARRESDTMRSELCEMQSKERLQETVGQHQQMEYIRNVFRKFVETAPTGTKEHEMLIPVLMTFFKFEPEATKAIQTRRSQSTGGFFGRWSG